MERHAELSFAARLKVAVEPGVPTGVTVTTGGVVSTGAATVQLVVTGTETFPAPSVARAEKMYVAGARSV